MNRTTIVVTFSKISAYMTCPRQAFFISQTGLLERRTDYSRLFGTAIHDFIHRDMYAIPKEPRAFRFKTIRSALGAWHRYWNAVVEESIAGFATRSSGKGKKKVTKQVPRLVNPSAEQTEKYMVTGRVCIAQYWKQNVDRARPIQIEEPYSWPLGSGVELRGRFDQVRDIPLEKIARFRPELIRNGVLIPGFAPVVVADLKTDRNSYDLRSFREDPSLEEEVRQQYQLHEGLQATIYTFLYEMRYGVKPVGFAWYHLRSGKIFMTYRDERDYRRMAEVIRHYLENIAAQSFPPNAGKYCEYCDYLEPCRENREHLIARPETMEGLAGELLQIPSRVAIASKQHRLKLKVPRVPAELPQLPSLSLDTVFPRAIMLPATLPWASELEDK